MSQFVGARAEAAAIGAATGVQAGLATAATPVAAAATATVSWPAILAGALVAGGSTVILGTLGVGLGLGSLSSWDTAAGVTTAAAIWLVLTQWVASGLGGYIAGRLRGRWFNTHAHESFFRDTAHGLTTWALSTLLMGVAWSSFMHMSSVPVSPAVSAMEAVGEAPAEVAYDTDQLFRPALTSVVAGPGVPLAALAADQRRDEARRIVEHAVRNGSVSDADRTYLAGLVAGATGASPGEAQRRTDDLLSGVFGARESAAARTAGLRRGAAEASIYLSLSLLVGAFIACVAAAIGGRLRDQQA